MSLHIRYPYFSLVFVAKIKALAVKASHFHTKTHLCTAILTSVKQVDMSQWHFDALYTENADFNICTALI